MNYFITGITGFLGTEIISEIMWTTEDTVFGLIRAGSRKEAVTRLGALWYQRPELTDQLGSRIIPVPGDITKADLGLSDADQERLIQNTDYIIHTAAVIGIRHSRQQFWDVNVTGTEHILNFAGRIQSNHPLRHFSYVSTAYVAGTRSGRIMEDSLVNAGFSSLYEQSKFEGESLVAQAMDQFPVSIFRPGQIVGDSRTGQIKNFNTLYYPLKLYLKQQMRVFPIKGSMHVNMVPVDYVAKAIVRITGKEKAAGKTFHLTAPSSMQPAVAELVGAVRDWAKENLSLNLNRPLYLPVPFLDRIGASRNTSESNSGKKNVLTNMLSLAPYFTEDKIFDTTNTERFMGTYNLDWQDYLPRLLAYAADKNFLDHNSRTVYEQVRFCLKRQRASVTYYDITADGIRESSASAVNEQIEEVLRSLQAMGVGPGSRVAISGINSVTYFILDIAIGLSGATSVPLYYTTPANELDELLQKSSADCFFIGDIRILSHVSQMTFSKKIISFTKNAPLPEDFRLISWEQFLSMGKTHDITPVTVSYQDIATIRYTSGTTGNSKEVSFTHGQMRWMAETMASLLSFKSRSKSATYLSFLPLSHVVEGILGMYTPYYLGAPASLYFLNDFDRLAETLPKVQPTIFFSIPRFYEKIWDQLAKNKLGALYISSENALLKHLLRPVLKKSLLKKAGLDQCDQLIVGSAPVSQKLLQDFRELGIEIHNAYGLTEAPLITLNRLGSNDITTVGPPLPVTTVTLAEDGEILVTGPQVSIVCGCESPASGSQAAANCGNDRTPCLHTGDLGAITASGHLQIIGRKKEILINSYGKNINLQKVETLLKDIPGISEALLVGEKRPYCVALLWPEDIQAAPDENALTAAVLAVNRQLSHPEQIKRYALMSVPLKISTGELTPNLKLRRSNITELHQQTIEGLYAPTATPAGDVLLTGAL
ncbi:MAG: AMP-binding protein [Lachnospiraceae bacterium]|nr:AMP-binding protein [Lachnospiraceae bacterium]